MRKLWACPPCLKQSVPIQENRAGQSRSSKDDDPPATSQESYFSTPRGRMDHSRTIKKAQTVSPHGTGQAPSPRQVQFPRQQTLAMVWVAFSQPPNPRPTTPSQLDTDMDSE